MEKSVDKHISELKTRSELIEREIRIYRELLQYDTISNEKAEELFNLYFGREQGNSPLGIPLADRYLMIYQAGVEEDVLSFLQDLENYKTRQTKKELQTQDVITIADKLKSSNIRNIDCTKSIYPLAYTLHKGANILLNQKDGKYLRVQLDRAVKKLSKADSLWIDEHKDLITFLSGKIYENILRKDIQATKSRPTWLDEKVNHLTETEELAYLMKLFITLYL